jgi:hypothetical protein
MHHAHSDPRFAPAGLARLFFQSNRTTEPGRVAKRASRLPIDEQIYLQFNATYYQRLHKGG